MRKPSFLPDSAFGKAQAFIQFKDNMGACTTTFGLAPGDITQQVADALYFTGFWSLEASVTVGG